MKRVALMFCLIGCAPHDAGLQAPVGSAEGEAVYQRYCALCHGPEGEGHLADAAPSLRDAVLLRSATDAFLRRSIAEGRPGTPMSAWSARYGGPLTDPQIDQLIEHLRSWETEPRMGIDDMRTAGDVTRGAASYANDCRTCHGVGGRAGQAPMLANPVLLSSASDGYLQHTILFGRPGSMPSFSDRLQAQQVDDVVAFLRSLNPARLPGTPQEQPHLPSLADLPVVLNPDGRAPDFEPRDGRFIPAAAVRQAIADGRRLIVLDARPTSDWVRGRVPGALPVPFYDISHIVEAMPHDGTWMIAYCACPHAASGHVVDALRQAGLEHTAIMDEGIAYWTTQGYPIATGPEPP